MISPDQSYKIKPNSGVFTFGALEQLAGQIEKMLDYLINQKPGICLHTEPAIELYDLENFEDYLAYKFQKKRGYSEGLIPLLKDLENAGRIKIEKIKRLHFGSLYMEGYNLIVWRPL